MSLAGVAQGVVLRAVVGPRALAEAHQMQEWEAKYGRPYVDRIRRMYAEIPWGLEDARYLAARLAVFEWMAALSGRSTG